MDISVIIPCFNHGHFIQEAIDSVELLSGVEYEIIIIDDGSTDSYTIQKIAELKQLNYNIISHPNRGLAYSRNIGIKNAKGKYILPLDADNKIDPAYVYKSLGILKDGKADIVYAKPIFFGDLNKARLFEARAFCGADLFLGNYIDACAIFDKRVWSSTGGYDENMPVPGHEDWELWLHAHIKEFKFQFLEEFLYFYRIVNGSMIESTINLYHKNFEYIIKKHASSYIGWFDHYKLINDQLKALEYVFQINKTDRDRPLRAIIKYSRLFLKDVFYKNR
ncbi:glycosyltransferase involved in cell wall biosynthesis [Pontibacter ummariensis]|uniref:Glycosyltransferase involved in cell wall bisynthesis n=1 Tax=Pontibacter ummariensis TaxID=1610492 RepID=A0A239BP95_9BACT|nr:glycosyltransferase family 2 protein [Pontibacter ummariensis]PRY15757.1 glycosyltransferase involved in cell wall biosynthesis [Pontibacter ummariensis]SNS08864.1 Glycosyltransferase involved in cell wall bisynthesis [Pontibacter ummariensis]